MITTGAGRKLKLMQKFAFAIVFFPLCIFSAPLNLSQSPLTVTQSVAPLTMLVMSKEHKLFLPAYPNYTDINGDGIVDLGYNPAINYYGYFDSYKCYRYDTSNRLFYPAQLAPQKKCTLANAWSGDWLNWATMTRIDALRKALYGGMRVQPESTTQTILTRTNFPQDAHSWGSAYTNPSVDGYNISQYTPLSIPQSGRQHLFANTTLVNNADNAGYMIGLPLLRISQNKTQRIWDWVSKERPITGQFFSDNTSTTPTDYVVRVKVCDPSIGLESNCNTYPNGNYKPVGLLQEFGENDGMLFGLLTGSYEKNMSGGVLRKNLGTFSNEINLTNGTINSNTNGIISTINKLSIPGFDPQSYSHEGSWLVNRPMNQGEFKPWGAPIAEMMYETLRYFSGKLSPTPAFATTAGVDGSLGLPTPAWQDPYQNLPYCSKANMIVIGDINPSYDSDQLPGNAFNSFTGDLSNLNVQALGDTIWNQEFGQSILSFIGQSGSQNDSSPTPKTVTSFGNIRGLTPDETTKQGSYYAASVAYHGWMNDLNTAQDKQNVKTYIVALNNPLPQIKIPVNGQAITIIPYARTVGGCQINGGSVNASKDSFQPTNQIVNFFIESWTPNSGTFRVSYEDVEQGADHEMDAIARYSYNVNANGTLTVSVTSEYAAGCLIQHLGYIISGTTQDGPYLVVRDADTTVQNDVSYFLDVLSNTSSPSVTNCRMRDNQTLTNKLGLTATCTFTPSKTPSAIFLNSPLFYAAKWGGFEDLNNNKIPDLLDEWSTKNNGIPDNYFLVTNPTNLYNELYEALNNILQRSSSSASAILSSGNLNSQSIIYQVLFNSANWTGQLLAFAILPDGTISSAGQAAKGALWDAATLIQSENYLNREILTYKPSSKKGIAFQWPSNPNSPSINELDLEQINLLQQNPDTLLNDNLGKERLNYLRGYKGDEKINGGIFRSRASLLGDIINSAPIYVGLPNMPYPDQWPGSALENNALYSDFKTQYRQRIPAIYVGSNDGMLHAFNAKTGEELFSYIPAKVFPKLSQLTSQKYQHHFYVDGSPNVMDVFIKNAWHTVLVSGLNLGGQGLFALDVTNPTTVTESQANLKVLWEFTDAQDRDLGFTYSQPALVRQANGKWVAIFGNGYNNTINDGATTTSTTGNGVLYIVDIETGNLIQKLDTLVGLTQDPLGTSRPNGLATPLIVDINQDYIADYIYVGDLFGNLWKAYWDVNLNQWRWATYGQINPTPIFVARNSENKPQPITSRPNARLIRGGIQIYFGTGKYLEPLDKDPVQNGIQSFYSIIDNLTLLESSGRITNRNQLLQQTINSEASYNASDGTTYKIRTTSNNILTGAHRGWFIDLVLPGANNTGERQISASLLRNGRIIFSTLIPNTNVCGFGGQSWLMELNAMDGSALPYAPYDLNNDKLFNASDFIMMNGLLTRISGIQSSVGLISTPGIINAGSVEYKYMSGSSGQIGQLTENPGLKITGRQSWRELN